MRCFRGALSLGASIANGLAAAVRSRRYSEMTSSRFNVLVTRDLSELRVAGRRKIEGRECLPPVGFRHHGGGKAVARKRDDILAVEPERLLHGAIVVVH